MISNKKLIQDAYSVQNFSTYFNIYTKVLTVIGIALFIMIEVTLFVWKDLLQI